MTEEAVNPEAHSVEIKIGFVYVVLGPMKIKNADLYITGSNSKMLSTDILTRFRGGRDKIRVNSLPLRNFIRLTKAINMTLVHLILQTMKKPVIFSNHRFTVSTDNYATHFRA